MSHRFPLLEAFEQSVASLPGVHGVSGLIENGSREQTVGLCEFRLDRSGAGWRALEFLAWWTGDLARRGTAVRLRPVALAPMAGDTIQFGETLRFQVELHASQSGPDDVASLVREITADFDKMLETYRPVVT